MFRWIKFYIELCFLKVAPQDAPGSKNAFYISVFCYFLVGALIIGINQDMIKGVFLSGVQTALLMFLANLVLWIKKTPERYEQTMSALCASGAIIGLIALPIMSVLNSGNELGVDTDAVSFGLIIWLSLIVWESIVIAHILKHSMDIPIMAGLAGSFIYMYLSITITVRILKVMSISIS